MKKDFGFLMKHRAAREVLHCTFVVLFIMVSTLQMLYEVFRFVLFLAIPVSGLACDYSYQLPQGGLNVDNIKSAS